MNTNTGDRVKKLRTALDLSQTEFGERIGVKKSAISGIETGRQQMASQMCHSICREFHVRENWLLYGEGDMFTQPEEFSLDDFLREHGADALEVQLMKAYFELDPDIRHRIVDQFKENLRREQELNRVADAEQEYIKSSSRNARNTDGSVSSSTEDAV